MPVIEDDKFKRRLARRLGEAAKRVARPRVAKASTTLADAMEVRVYRLPGAKRSIRADLTIPHYWAVYVHDGRRPFRKGRYMVWWRNPKLDPRLRDGRTPKRARDLRRLSRDQFLAAAALRQQWIKQGGDPYDAPVIITKEVRKATPPNPFFENGSGGGMAGFRSVAGRLAQNEFSRFVREQVGESFDYSETISIRL